METALHELTLLVKDLKAHNADMQAQLNAQRIVIKALIVSHATPQKLHEALLDEMDLGADPLQPQRVADTAEFVSEFVQMLTALLAPPSAER